MNILLLKEALLLAHEYGIENVKHLSVFISISQADGISVTELAGCRSQDDQAKWYQYASIVQLILNLGEGEDGLIYRAEPVMGTGGRPPQKLRLTAKGFRLLEELRALGFQ